MGMATYYLKARFASPTAAQAALPKFTALINEGTEAEAWWRTNGEKQCDKSFWVGFKQRFPQVYEFLGPSVRADPQRGDYVLNFGDRDNPSPLVEGKLLFFSAYVWHFADWALLAQFVKSKLGALGVDWISEESVDPFDLLNP